MAVELGISSHRRFGVREGAEPFSKPPGWPTAKSKKTVRCALILGGSWVVIGMVISPLICLPCISPHLKLPMNLQVVGKHADEGA